MKLPTPQVLAAGLLSLSCVFGATAWIAQADAARAIAEARATGAEDVESEGSGAPDLGDYRRILATLENSIGIRRDVDALLGRVEELVASLERRQTRAAATAEGAANDLARIGRRLGSAAAAARASTDDLGTLTTGLERSEVLARAIARELEELDRSFGPTVGRREP